MYNEFVDKLKKLAASTQTKLIANYGTDKQELTSEFDAYRVNLEPNKLLTQLIANINPFEEYLSLSKAKNNFIWSFKSFEMPPYQYEQRRYMLIALYSILYSLPGSVIIRQGDELEYTNRINVPQIFRWNDIDTHSGFSLTIQQNLWWFPIRINRVPVIEDGFDLPYVNGNRLALINFLRLLNQNVKYKLISDRFNFNLSDSLFKMIRYTLNSKKDIIFLLNFSRKELQLSKYVDYEANYLNNTNNNSNSTVYRDRAAKITTIYDSTHVLTHYEEIFDSTSFHIKSNQYLILELETF